MPIKVKCSCGQALTVPDNLAGKTGKCPKCQSAIKIPAASAAGGASPAKPAAAKPAASKPASKPAPAPAPAPAAVNETASDDVFDEIGLKKKTGPTCPKCGAAISKTTALCTSCGFNIQTGEQLVGFNAQSSDPEFKNMYLQEAVEHMARDAKSGERHAKSGMPWWMIAAFFLGAVCIAIEGVVIVDGTINEPAPADTFLGRVQRQKISVSSGITFGLVGGLITLFAHLSIATFAFQKSVGKGFLCLFTPVLYAPIFGLLNWQDNKAAVMATLWGLILVGGGLGMAAATGWIQ